MRKQMWKRMLALLLVFLLTLLLVACRAKPAEPQPVEETKPAETQQVEETKPEEPKEEPVEKNGDLYILYTSDVHCGIDQGMGYAGVYAIKQQLIRQGYDVILVDNGDAIQGEPIGTMTKGSSIIEIMNKVGYDLAIPGNHEFDYGMETFLSLVEKAQFPYLSCNFEHEGKLVLEPYTIRELAGKKIGFIGVTTPHSLTTSTPSSFKDKDGNYVYGFLRDAGGEKVYEQVQKTIDSVRAEGAEYVVVLGHLGGRASDSPWSYADIISHTKGIDVLLDGHGHDAEQVPMKDLEGKTVLRSASGTKLANVGWCKLTADGKLSTGLFRWDNEIAAPKLLGIDNEVATAVEDAQAELNETLAQVVASSQVDLTIFDPTAVDSNGRPIRMVRRAETNLGDLCADAYRIQSGADVAIVNGGGVRVSIAAGDITLGNILSVFPFGNSLCVIEVTGQQILDALEWGARSVPDEHGGFAQVSGLTYEIHVQIPSPCKADDAGLMIQPIQGERRVKNVKIGEEPLDPNKTYTLAGHNYMLMEHGDGFTVFDGATVLQDCVKLDNQLLIDYIVDDLGGVIGPEYEELTGQDRIVIVE